MASITQEGEIESREVLGVISQSLSKAEKSIASFSENMKELNSVTQSLENFNSSFANVLAGLTVNSECFQLQFPLPIEDEPKVVSLQKAQIKSKGYGNKSNITSSRYGRSRVGLKGNGLTEKVIRRKKGSFSAKSIVRNLPTKYHGPPHSRNIEVILKFLKLHQISGAYLEDIVKDSNLPRLRVNEYLNALLRSNDLLRESKKGLLYKLNPSRYY